MFQLRCRVQHMNFHHCELHAAGDNDGRPGRYVAVRHCSIYSGAHADRVGMGSLVPEANNLDPHMFKSLHYT